MSTTVTFNGTSYTVPAIGDASWGNNVSNYLIAIATGCLQKTGGSFTLTAETDFGATYGLKSVYIKGRTTNPAAAGVVRLAKTDTIGWRNNANGADLALGINASDVLQFNSVSLVDLSSAQTLTNKSMSGSSNTFTNLPATGLTGLVSPANGGTGVANNSASTLTISGSFGTTLTVSNTTALTLPTSGTVAVTSNNLSVFASTTSSQLAGVISDETGSGALVFGTSPTLTTPTIGVATATSINKMAITAPATSSTLAVADGKTFTASNTLTLAGTDGNTLTFPSGSATVMTVTGTQSPTNKTFDNTNALTIKVGSFTLQDGTDTSKQAVFQLSGMTTGKTLTLASAATNNRTVTFPDSTNTLATLAGTETLTNKILSGNTAVTLISGSGTLTVNTSGTITVPNATDTLVGKATTDTLTNKTLTTPTLTTPVMGSYADFTEIATPATPSAGTLRAYSKSDDNLYIKNSGGTETQIITSATSASTAQLAKADTNLIINGGFDVWQRGTSAISASSAGVYTADMWSAAVTSFTTMTVAQSSDVPTQAQSGYSSSFSLLATNGTGASAGSTDYTQLFYRMEGYDYAQIYGNAVTLQFWVKSSLTGTFSVAFRGNSETYVTTYTISSSNTWERKTVSLTMDTAAGYNLTNSAAINITFGLAGGSTVQTNTLGSWQAGNYSVANTQTNWSATTSATFKLAQVMLLPNDYSSLSGSLIPFKRTGRSFQDEVARCQRYYEKSFAQGNIPASQATTDLHLFSHAPVGANGLSWSVPYKVTKRAAPTLTLYNNAGTSARVTEIDGPNGAVTVSSSSAFSADTCDDHFRIYGTLSSGSSAGIAFCWIADASL